MIAIDEVQDLLQGLRGAGEAAPFSFIEVCCTNLTILAFDQSQPFPKYVVRIGDEFTLRTYWEKLLTLSQLLPKMIPAAVDLIQLRQDRWMLVQAGVPGTPWFSLSSKIKNGEDSAELVNASLEVLNKFHAVVNSQAGWRKTLVLKDAFELIVRQVRLGGIVFPESAESEIATAMESLKSMGEIECHWQHGDFCFNNLVFHRQETFLLDFDDFGRSSFPLLDQVGLAYSISERIPDRDFIGALRTAAKQSQFPQIDSDQLRAFVVCQLINALAGTIGVERLQMRQTQLLREISNLHGRFK